jgi:hypothetical protein
MVRIQSVEYLAGVRVVADPVQSGGHVRAANFTMNQSPTTALDDQYSGPAWAAGSGTGTVAGHPLSSGTTTRSASPSAPAEHSPSRFILWTRHEHIACSRYMSRSGTNCHSASVIGAQRMMTRDA